MAYTTQTAVEDYLQRQLTESEVGVLPNLISATKIWLDTECNSTFDEVSATARVYDGGEPNAHFDSYSTHPSGHGYTSISIDPCTNITEVDYVDPYGIVSPLFVQATLYVTSPPNKTVKNELRMRFGRKFPVGEQNIQVTAQFSEYDAANGGVPSDIQVCAQRICARILKSSYDDSLNGSTILEVLGDHRVQSQSTLDWINTIALRDPIVVDTISQRQEPIFL